MENGKNQPKIIALPYQLASREDLEACDDMGVYSFQLRLHGVEMIRLIQAGKLQPTEDVVRILKDINALLQEFGRAELSLDFLN